MKVIQKSEIISHFKSLQTNLQTNLENRLAVVRVERAEILMKILRIPKTL
jgi:hypothetical protein